MRIAIVSPGFGYGGSYIAAANVGKSLGNTHDVYYFAYQFDTNYSNVPDDHLFFFGHEKSNFRKQSQRINKGVALFLHHEFIPSHYLQPEIERLLQLLEAKQIELVILNTFQAVSQFSRVLKTKRPEIKLVGWMHEATTYSFGKLTHNYRRAFVDGLKALDMIVCLTQVDYERFYQINHRVQIIYNSTTLVPDGVSSLNNHTIAFTTRLNIEVKGLDYLVQVANQLPDDWKIELAGQGHPEQTTAFMNLLRENVKPGKINYCGPLSGSDLAAHYQNSSMFLSTSRTEAFGMAIAEALSFGLPVISFDHSGGHEILQNEQGGLLVPIGDVDAMVKQIKVLISDPKRMRQLQVAGLKRFNDFKLPVITREWDILLNKLMS